MAFGVATVFAGIFGDMNFWYNMQPYYDIHNLNAYTSVNPATESGQRLMDAGKNLYTGVKAATESGQRLMDAGRMHTRDC
jgi:hypothetical protein